MKSYTDLEQSKRLAEFLPFESADMFWYRDAVTKEANPRIMNYMQVPELQSMYYSPCWSLSSLLEIINKDFYTDLYHNGELWTVDVQHHDNGEISDFVYDDEPIDACVKIIVKLKEKGIL